MAEEVKVGLFGHLKAGRAHGEAAAAAAREAAELAEKAPKLTVDSAGLAASAKAAAAAERGAVEAIAKAGGKELPFMSKMMFNIGKSAPVRLIARNPKKSIALGVAALGTLAFTMRSKRKELPPQEQLTPIEALPAPVEVGPAEGRAANEWQNRVRGGQPALQPALSGAPDVGRV